MKWWGFMYYYIEHLWAKNVRPDTCDPPPSIAGTDIKDKVRTTLSTPALMKMLNTSADASDSRVQPLEESGIMALETPPPNSDKLGESAFLRSLPLECDLYESDMMLETSMSDTST